ncbi:trehalose-6-phosphate synthase [Viridibacterium curvum]|uniref:Trehalose-6-phosphate synthase n=1 Tax=Viridibacterium curvum TaxID=1101404 RepID=A0ABP9QKB3_9RHOO
MKRLNLYLPIRLQLRFVVPLILVMTITALFSIPLIDSLTMRWVLRDLGMRASLVTTTLSDSIDEALRSKDPQSLQPLFQRAIRDEKLMAIALCGADGSVLQKTPEFPPELRCADANAASRLDSSITLQGRAMHVATRSVEEENTRGIHLVLLHDLGFQEQRSRDTRNYLLSVLAVLGAVISATTVLIANLSWRSWVSGVKSLLRGEEGSLAPQPSSPEFSQVADELRRRLRQLEDEHRRAHTTGQEWDAARLKSMLKSDLRDEQLIVASNREPSVHVRRAGKIVTMRPASGLVTAVEPILRACSGTWIAHGSGDADRDTVDSRDHILLPEHQPAYTLRRLWIDRIDEAGYYYGFANGGLWPLCHIAHVRPTFREADWECYRRVNEKFAAAVIAEARIKDPLILIQDYHLALAPRMIREKLPDATIISFWHIPWPNPESFGICPWREELLDGMLGSTIIGFHTRFHCKNFMETVDRYLETRIEQEHSTISFRGQPTLIESYPISIHWPSERERAAWPTIAKCRRDVRQRLGLDAQHLIALGLDRFDYTKGITERMQALRSLLEQQPQLVGRLSLVQIAAPTREELDEYQAFRVEIEQLAAQINARFARDGYRAIYLFTEHKGAEEVQELYRAADICLVTSIHDGMNLVCKEFIAARDDEDGVLILSQFAGASRELSEALHVNPYHIEETAQAMLRALNMPIAERRERMQSLRSTVREYNVYRWAGAMLGDAARLRLKDRVQARVRAYGSVDA